MKVTDPTRALAFAGERLAVIVFSRYHDERVRRRTRSELWP